MLRFLLGLIGAGALIAMMHKTIMAGGGYDHGDAETIAETMVVIAAAIAIAPIFRSYWIIGSLVIIALVAGDAARFGRVFVNEMDRLTALQAPATKALQQRQEAQKRLDAAKAAEAAIGSTTSRLDAALRAKSETERGVREKTSERGCRKLCAAQLAEQMKTANAELLAAQQELTSRRLVASQRVSAAEAALASIAIPSSVSPAADLIGWSAAFLNAVLAGAKSVALNLGAIALLAVAGHNLRLSRRPPPAAPDAPNPIESAREQIARFALDRYQPDANGQLLLTDAYSDYRRWCEMEGARIVPVQEFVREFDLLTQRANLEMRRDNDNQLVVCGMAPMKLLGAAVA